MRVDFYFINADINILENKKSGMIHTRLLHLSNYK